MKVTIQIPTYRQEGFIVKAIESALMQDYEFLDVVVLDDCSPDKTYEVASSIRHKDLRVFRNEKNLGRTGTYRRLLYELDQGEWVVNLDGDDYFTDPGFISRGVLALSRFSNLVFYQACISNQTPDSSFRFRHKMLGDMGEGLVSGPDYFRRFHKNEFFGHLSTIYHAGKARQTGFYQYNNLTSDAESMLKLALQGDVYLDNRVVGVWNIHGQNESGTNLEKNDEILSSFERLRDYARPYIGESDAESWYREALAINHRSYMEQIAERDFSRFLKEALSSGYINSHLMRLTAKKLLGRI